MCTSASPRCEIAAVGDASTMCVKSAMSLAHGRAAFALTSMNAPIAAPATARLARRATRVRSSETSASAVSHASPTDGR
jgi:hypothetical protein